MAVGSALLSVWLLGGSPAVAQDEAEPEAEAAAEPAPEVAGEVELFARVIVDSSALRSGPGSSFRRVGMALRGDIFPVKRRATTGYWFQVERPDGTLARILGDAVYNHEVGPDDERRPSRIFSPPPLGDAHIELAVMFGALGSGGSFAFRPMIVLAPEFGIELNAQIGVSRAGQTFVLGGGGVVNVFPRSPVVPFLVVGGGIAISDPNADTFLLESGSTAAMYGGGGLRFGFRQRITLRIEVRSYVFFEPGRYVTMEEYSGGMSVFF